MFDREAWLDAISNIDEDLITEYYSRKMQAMNRIYKKKNAVIKWVAGFAAVIFLGVVGLYIYKNVTAPRANGAPNPEYQKTHAQFSSLAEAEKTIGSGYFFSGYSDTEYKAAIELEYIKGGSAEERSSWTKLECYLEKEDIIIYYHTYYPGYQGRRVKYLKKDDTRIINVDNTDVQYSVYDEDDGFSVKNYALEILYDTPESRNTIEYFCVEPIGNPEELIRKLIQK